MLDFLAMFERCLSTSEVGFRIREEQFLFILEYLSLEELIYLIGNQQKE
jgi:hypothetical protein